MLNTTVCVKLEEALVMFTVTAFVPLTLTDDVTLLIVDALAEIQENQDGTASSFSNDGVSVSLSKPVRTESEIMSSVYDQVVEILPIELVSVVIR